MSGFQFPFGLDQIGKTYEEKDDAYRKMILDQYCMVANEFNYDFRRMRENYLLKNSRLPKEQYRYLCSALGDGERTDMFIDMFNFTGNVIDALKGEELGRPFPFSVVSNSERINNRTERLKREMINNLIEEIFKIETEKIIKIKELEMSGIPKEELESKSQLIEEEYKIRFNNLPNIKDIFKRYNSITSLEEITMNKVMKMLYHKYHIKKLKNDCFEDLLLTASEFVEIYCDHENSLPRIKRLNPLHTFYQKSPDVEYIHEADFAGYKERISIDQAIEMYGEYMTEEDFLEVVTMGANWGILGMDHKFFSDGKNPDPWRSQRFGDGGVGYSGSGYNGWDEWVNVGMEEYGGENYGFVPNRPVDYYGLHTTLQRRNMNRYIDKYVVYWKSNRKVGRLTYYNEYGEIETTIVDEEFQIPKNAKKSIIKRDNLTKDLIQYSWLDGNNKKMSLEWFIIKEVWKGIRLGRKHIVVEPLVASYKSLLNPFEVKLPIYGVVINNANAVALSKMDAMKPWQKLYFALMAKTLKLIHQDKGIWAIFNSLFFDKDQGTLKSIAIAEDQGYLITNPLSGARGGEMNILQNMKPVDHADMSNFKAIQQYLTMLAFIEENIVKAAGMSPQRIAQSTSNTTATDNYRETQSSMNITEPMFYSHDIVWEHIMRGYMEMVLTVISENTGILKDFLNDEEQAVVDFDYISLTDNYNLRIGNSGKQVRILEQTQQLTQALIQNDKINLSQFISLMKSEDLTEFQVQLRELEELNKKREEAMQRQQQEHEQQMESKKMKVLEDAQINELQKEYLKGYMAYHRDYMKGVLQNQSFDAQKDYNKDGIPDYFQIEQMNRKLDIENKKVDVKSQEIQNKLIKENRELDLKEKELSTRENEINIKSADEKLKLRNQEKINQIKAAITRNKKSK